MYMCIRLINENNPARLSFDFPNSGNGKYIQRNRYQLGLARTQLIHTPNSCAICYAAKLMWRSFSRNQFHHKVGDKTVNERLNLRGWGGSPTLAAKVTSCEEI